MELLSPDIGEQKPSIVPLEFWVDHEPDGSKPGELRPVHWVKYAKKGQNGATIVDKVARKQQELNIWPAIEPYYEAWLKGQEEPEDGTPLSAWPGLTRGQADALKAINIRTVEDLAMLTDAQLESVGMGARALRAKALVFVETQQDKSGIEAALLSRDSQISDLTAQLEELTETVQKLTVNKPRRGRPPNAAKGLTE